MSLLFSSLSDYPAISANVTAMITDRVTTPGDVVVVNKQNYTILKNI